MAEPHFARIPAWVIGRPELSASGWRVYACLARHASRSGWAWPSMSTIAEETKTRREDVPRSIRYLEKMGAIYVERGGGRSPNRYQILFEGRAEVSENLRTVRNAADPESANPRTERPQKSASGVRNAADLTDRTDHLTDSAPRPARERVVHLNGAGDPFEHFCQIYPSRGGHSNPKKPARLEFEALLKRGMDPAVIIRGAEKYRAAVERDGTDPRYIAQAVTFLRQERFNEYQQGPPPPPLRVGMI